MDRVRAAIFSSLGDAVPGASVLDLFAGSGAMGIEALSRGAASAIFVDLNPGSVACVKDNLRKTKFQASVQTMDALKFLELYAAPESFDLIFADPPYSKPPDSRDFAAELAMNKHLAASLKPGGIFVLERVRRSAEIVDPPLECIRVKQYGESEIVYFRRP
jgi:16S rRNA (guanine966-N2)-methyltransferase